ncbi:MAG TPA: DUF5317 domain-containing protein [Anaerolineales bacterium]|nr:DUF5317 domain-containing protein [Anaerolineales bacterium]
MAVALRIKMILLLAVFAGLLVGLLRAYWYKQPYEAPSLRAAWLVVIAFLPQLLIAYLPATHQVFTGSLASVSLLASLTLFFIFAWLNRHLPGMPILIVGLLLNFVVIVANGGWMPISPQTANLLAGRDVLQVMDLGSRFGEKDVLLPVQNMQLEFLADRFLLPAWFPYKVAFSLGDVLIGLGAFWLLVRPTARLNPSSMEGVVI